MMGDEKQHEPIATKPQGGWGRREAKPPATPLADSPWFWAALFSAVALAALVALSGKYGRRQANIELKFQAREQVRWSEEGNEQKPKSHLEYSQPGATVIPLWPLSIVLGSVIVVSVVMLIRARRINRGDAEGAEKRKEY